MDIELFCDQNKHDNTKAKGLGQDDSDNRIGGHAGTVLDKGHEQGYQETEAIEASIGLSNRFTYDQTQRYTGHGGIADALGKKGQLFCHHHSPHSP